MPKKLKIHPGQRIDIPDLEHAANGYTQASLNFHRREIQSKRTSEVIRGFRIEVPDQGTFPGQITIHNGTAIDKNGELVTDEVSFTDSRTITLVGASLSFYIEVEFAEEESDIDDRAIWDPTFANPDGSTGKEFIDNVTTRISPTWKIVSPVSTSGFEASTDSSSTKIPIAILSTNGSGEITTGVNTGLVLEPARTVLEEDVSAGATEANVVNSFLFPTSGTVTIDGETVTLSGNDKVQGILKFAGTPLAGAHEAGTLVEETTSGAPVFVQERSVGTLSLDEFDASTSTHPDKRRKLYTGDEIRGAALLSSKVTAGERDETQLASLKDRVDSLAAIIQELKVGRVLSTGTTKIPEYDVSPINSRYFNLSIGSVQGVRTAHYTLGDGVNSLYGDVLDNTHQGFQDVLDAAAGDGITEVYIYVKQGTYTFTSNVTIPSSIEQVVIQGQPSPLPVAQFVSATARNLFAFSGAVNRVSFENISIDVADGSLANTYFVTSTTANNPKFRFVNCTSVSLDGGLVSITGAFSSVVEIDDCDFTGTTAAAGSFINASGIDISGHVKNTSIEMDARSTAAVDPIVLDVGVLGADGKEDLQDFVMADTSIEFSDTTGGGDQKIISCTYLNHVRLERLIVKSKSNLNGDLIEITGSALSTNFVLRDSYFTFDTGLSVGSSLTSLINVGGSGVDKFHIEDVSLTQATLTSANTSKYFVFGGSQNTDLTFNKVVLDHSGDNVPNSVIEVSGADCKNIIIENSKFVSSATDTIAPAILFNSAGVESCYISKNLLNGFGQGIDISLVDTSNIDPGKLSITDNSLFFTPSASLPADTDSYGISVSGDIDIPDFDLVIKSNYIKGFSGTGGSGVASGIQVSNPGAGGGFSSITIAQNNLENIGDPSVNTSLDDSNGIFFDSSSIFQSTVYIIENIIRGVEAVTFSKGINLSSSFVRKAPIVSGNKITNIGNNTNNTSALVRGIDILNGVTGFGDTPASVDSDIENIIIRNNVLKAIGNNLISVTSGNLGTVKGISVASSSNLNGWVVDGNYIRVPEDTGSASLVCIEIFDGTSISINNNYLSGEEGAVVTLGAKCEQVNIQNNTVQLKEGKEGLSVYVNTSSVVTEGINITGNTLSGGASNDLVSFIKCDVTAAPASTLSSISISNNVITETVENTSSAAIGIDTDGLNGYSHVITGNIIQTTAASHASTRFRNGIFVKNSNSSTVSNNVVKWNVDDTVLAANQSELYFEDSFNIVITGNMILSTPNSPGVGNGITVDNVDGYIIDSNLFTENNNVIFNVNTPTNGLIGDNQAVP